MAAEIECPMNRSVLPCGASGSSYPRTSGGPMRSVPYRGRECVETRMVTMCPSGGYTKSEPGAVATGSFPRCSTTPIITKSGLLEKSKGLCPAFRPGSGSDRVVSEMLNYADHYKVWLIGKIERIVPCVSTRER